MRISHNLAAFPIDDGERSEHADITASSAFSGRQAALNVGSLALSNRIARMRDLRCEKDGPDGSSGRTTPPISFLQAFVFLLWYGSNRRITHVECDCYTTLRSSLRACHSHVAFDIYSHAKTRGRAYSSPLPNHHPGYPPPFSFSRTTRSSPLSLMSHSRSTTASSSKFQLIINDALKVYNRRTKNDLLLHPLAIEIQNCDSPSDILSVFQQQVQGPDQSRRGDDRWTKWLDPTINILLAFSQTAGTVGLAFSPTTVVFAGIGVLLSTAKDVRASQETLLDIFERIEMFFRRLEMYTEVPLTTEMTDVIIEIMAEVLSVLGIATKEIKQSRTKKYMRRLIGRTDMEDALKRLDKLTREEARMAVAQNLKMTHSVDERVRGVANTVEAIDNRVVGVDDRVAGVDDRVARVDNRVAGVDDKVISVHDKVANVDDNVLEVLNDGKEAKQVIKQTANDVDQVKQNQLRDSIHKWLSPPDPSTNHNIACDTDHKKTATWFFQGSIFREWKSKGSLLWIHGKPGSGKSILCSTVIQDIKAMCEAEEASMAYFYFDFRNANKQGLRDLVSSLLTQLSARSSLRCDILSKLYLVHDGGKEQPSDGVLTKCLKDMLTLPDHPPIYLIIDALDESPNTLGIPSARERVLRLLKELVDLCVPNLHICVTSRPEVDIRDVIVPLTSLRVSLHDQSGQKEDIADYVRSIVYSNSEPIIRRWKTEDKDLVIKMLSERADGMFRWVFCQLEVLRHCLPSSVRRFLDELPESLDETYERVLREIKKPNRDHARRLLQCLVAAIRPLRVEELAEVLAIDFDDASGTPKLNPSWRWEDQEQALLTSCSSLITIVETGSSRVVQFSHFSVKEYLISTRLATSSQDVLRYHIVFGAAHTIMAQACLSILLRLDNPIEDGSVEQRFPLAEYAAEYWVRHAQFEDVASRIKGMEDLFDLDRPYFAAWCQLHDIDVRPQRPSVFFEFLPSKSGACTPLYYAALCGFPGLVERLIVKYPQHVNAIGGHYMTPAVAALAGRHFQLARLLHRNGSSLDPHDSCQSTPLHSVAGGNDIEMVQVLLDCGVDVNDVDSFGSTPLDFASLPSFMNSFNDVRVVELLLDHGADPNVLAWDRDGLTPLHRASQKGRNEMVRLLVEHGANVEMKDKEGRTPLEVASGDQRDDIIKLLLEHSAN